MILPSMILQKSGLQNHEGQNHEEEERGHRVSRAGWGSVCSLSAVQTSKNIRAYHLEPGAAAYLEGSRAEFQP
jgi:hypothetical protein